MVDAADGTEVIKVAFLRFAGDFVEESEGVGIEARFGRIVGGVDDIDLDLDRVLAALDPAFSAFASFAHGSILKKYCDQFSTPAGGQPCPDTFYFRTIGQELPGDCGWVWLAVWPFAQQPGGIDARGDLPRRYQALFAPHIRMPTDDKAILVNSTTNIVEKSSHGHLFSVGILQ